HQRRRDHSRHRRLLHGKGFLHAGRVDRAAVRWLGRPRPQRPQRRPMPVRFTVTRTAADDGSYPGALVVSTSVGPGGTADSADYDAPAATVTIPYGQASAEFDIVPVDDQGYESDTTVEGEVDGPAPAS